MNNRIKNLHHVTAIASDPQRNIDFYAGMLGLRLVKQTVNFDDPSTYHLYFGDELGTPGSLITFFPWPGASRGRQGPGQVAVTSFAVLPQSIGFWIGRLIHHGVAYQGPTTRGPRNDGERVLSFKDPDGLMLEIVGHSSAEARSGWTGGVPAEHAIRGVHSVTIWVETYDQTEHILLDTLGFTAGWEHDGERRYTLGTGGAAAILNVRAIGEFLPAVEGAGIVHHVAWAVTDDSEQISLREAIQRAGLFPTPVINRNYFHSVYFREPGGVLFEIATDGPGFAVDESADQLGTRLSLPPQFESRRRSIEAVLPSIHLPASSQVKPPR